MAFNFRPLTDRPVFPIFLSGVEKHTKNSNNAGLSQFSSILASWQNDHVVKDKWKNALVRSYFSVPGHSKIRLLKSYASLTSIIIRLDLSVLCVISNAKGSDRRYPTKPYAVGICRGGYL